jgi:hypothetical protein
VPAPGCRAPFRREESGRLARSACPATGERHDVQRVRRAFGMARFTAYYLKAQEAVPPELRPAPGKRGPAGAATEADPVGHIRRVLAASPFHGEGCARSGVAPSLAFKRRREYRQAPVQRTRRRYTPSPHDRCDAHRASATASCRLEELVRLPCRAAPQRRFECYS